MSESVDVEIRFYQQGDDEKIVELLKRTFPKWADFKDPVGLWRWKYINNPLKNFIVVAVNDDNILGFEHSLFFNAKLGSEITLLAYGDDAAVDIDYRGLGIWKKISTYHESEYYRIAKYSFSTTTNPIVLKTWIKRNRSLFPFTITRMVKIKNINYILETRQIKKRFFIKLGYLFLKTLNGLMNAFRPSIKIGDDFKIIEISEFDDKIDIFWDNVKDDYNFIIEKKKEYLNWRFTDNDRGIHVKFQAMRGDEVLGYVVAGFKKDSLEGQIQDLIALESRQDVAYALMETVCNYLENIGITNIFYQVVMGHTYHALSTRQGFVDSRSRPKIEFDWSDTRNKTEDVAFIKETRPSQVYFSYATTV